LWSEDFAGTPNELEEALTRRVVERQQALAEMMVADSVSPDFPA
jgi:hypothetical protein